MQYISIWVRNLNNQREDKIGLPADEEDILKFMQSLGIYNAEGVTVAEYIIPTWNFEAGGSELDARDFASIENTDIDTVNGWAERLADVDNNDDMQVLQAIAEAEGGDIGDVLDTYDRDNYVFYSGMSLEDVAYEIVDNCYNLPEFAARYFDYKAFARDLGFDGYTETSTGVILLD